MSREERQPIVDVSSSSGDDEAKPVVRRRSTRDTELALPKDPGCCDPESTPHRFLALVFMCLLGFGMSLEFLEKYSLINTHSLPRQVPIFAMTTRAPCRMCSKRS